MSDYQYDGDFKKKYNYEKRRSESSRVLKKYPDRIPVIVENGKSSCLPMLDKRKYLVPDDMTLGQFMYIIRKRLTLPSDKAMFIFFGRKLPVVSNTMGTIYNSNKDEDLFLYCTINAESTFG